LLQSKFLGLTNSVTLTELLEIKGKIQFYIIMILIVET